MRNPFFKRSRMRCSRICDRQDLKQALRTVYKVTDTFIMCGLDGRFYRNDDRDYRSQSKLRLSGIATVEEIDQVKLRPRQRSRETTIEKNRNRLLRLLPHSVRLRLKEGTWELWLDEFLHAENLTDAQVRRIAALLSEKK
jgi:hypothetical protein